MKLKFIVSFLLLTSCVRQQIEESEGITCIQIVDHNGCSETVALAERLKTYQQINFLKPQPYRQVVRIFHQTNEGKTPSVLTSYHPNGNIKQYLEGIDTVASGSYREWFPNGTLKIEATVVGGPCDLSPSAQAEWLFDQTSTAWNNRGELEAKIQYQSGALHGDSTYYYPNGSINKKISYRYGLIDGNVSTFFPSGQLRSESFYEKGVKEGPSVGFWEDGKTAFFEAHEKGLLVTATYYDTNMMVVSEIENGYGKKAYFKKGCLERFVEFRQGAPEGKVECFGENGALLREFETKQGMKQGTETEYFLSLQGETKHPKLSIDWELDMVHGRVKTWYPDGAPKTETEYDRNQKNGLSFCWYQDGSLMFSEEYQKDELIHGSYYKIRDTKPYSKVFNGSGTATFFDGATGKFVRKIEYQNGKVKE